MKIVVLAAGTSTEREVSIVSGTEVCKALRSRGHQAILVDVFFGKEGADPATAFDGDYDVDAEAAYISSFNAQVKDAVASGREFFGPGVMSCVRQRMWSLWHFTERMVKMEEYRPTSICAVSRIPEPVI